MTRRLSANAAQIRARVVERADRRAPSVDPRRADREPRVNRRSALTAAAAVLVPPAAWALALGLSYIVQDFACTAAASAAAAPPEQALRLILTALNAILLVLTLVAGVAGYILARRSSGPSGPQVLCFLGYVGAVLALLFSFGIILIGANPLVFQVCR